LTAALPNGIIGEIMTSQERVMAALSHAKPDRVPRYEIFFKSFADNWRRAKQLPPEADIAAYYQIDILRLNAVQQGPFLSKVIPEQKHGSDYVSRDSWGRTRRRLPGSDSFEVISALINERKDLDSIKFDDPAADAYYGSISGMHRSEDEGCTRVAGTMGLFQACTWLRGEIPFMMDLLCDEEFCRDLVSKLKDFVRVMGEQTAIRADTLNSAFWVYDDFSINTGPMVSPDIFERIFLEPYRSLLRYWKSIGIQHLILHHDVMTEKTYPIIDMFLDAGITGIQGVYPTGGLSLADFKSRYGRRLAVIGGMWHTHTLPFGSKKEIEHEAAAIVEVARDGGVIIGSHSIEGYIPVENYDCYHNFIVKYGRFYDE